MWHDVAAVQSACGHCTPSLCLSPCWLVGVVWCSSAASVCAVATWLQAHGFGPPPATAHGITHVPGHANAAAPTAVAAAAAALVQVRFQLQYLLTATYKRMRFFWERAVGGRTFNGGASTAAVLQRKLGKQQRPPPRPERSPASGGSCQERCRQ